MTLALENIREIKKHVSAIHIGGKLSLLQRKFYNVLLYHSYDELLTREKHQIRIADLCELAGFDSRNQEVLKETLVSLSKTAVVWNLLGDDDVEEWGVSTMLSEAIIRKGTCTYAFSPSLREKLYKPELYARINLKIQSKFSGTHAFALYENAVRFRAVGTTGWKDLDFWRNVLGIQKDEYKQFKDFNKRVIKPAVEEVNSTSDILLKVDYQREKRRVTGLKFEIKNNPQMPIPFPLKKEELLAEMRHEVQEGSDLKERLMAFGLSRAQTQKLLAEHEEEYIRGNLLIVEQSCRAGKVENLPAYTLTAMKNDFRPKLSPYQAALIEAKQVKKQAQAERLRRQEEQEALQREQDVRDLQQALSSLSTSQRSALEARFREQHSANPVFRKWQDHGLQHPVIQSLYRAFAKSELLSTPQAA